MPMTPLSNPKINVLHHLVTYVVRQRPGVLATTLMGVVSSAIEVIAMASLIPISLLASNQPILARSLWHRIPTALGFEPNVKFYAAAFIVLLAIRTASSALNLALVARTHRALVAHFSARALDGFIRHLSFADVQKEAIGHFIALTGDEANRAAQIIMYLMKVVPISALLLFYLVTLFYQSWIGGLMLIGFFVLTVACLWEAFRFSLSLGKRQQEQARVASTHLLESLNGLRTVRGFNGEDYVASQYDRMMREYTWTCLAIDLLNLLSRSVPAMVLLLVTLFATMEFIDVTWLALNLSFIFVGAMMVLRLLPLAGQALDLVLKLTSDLRAAENLSDMLSAVEESKYAEAKFAPPRDEAIKTITFDSVTFRYSDDTPLVLDKYSMTFEAGKSYAITGPSGVGKSSLIDLLLKFYSPQGGTIRVNGRDIAPLSSTWIREHVALAEQTTRLFFDTVIRNVIFGREASRDEAGSALRVVGLSDFLATLPGGADTPLTYQGSNFSGGQRQRVGLARALLKSSDVLVIDEGTSALDHETRARVLRNILDSYRDNIVIFVTHDTVVMNHVDEVITLLPSAQAELAPTIAQSA